MAEVSPLHALRYDLPTVGSLADVVAPPYDVIDPEQRAALAARSPYNVVHIDLPEGDDPYAAAASLLHRWRSAGAIDPRGRSGLWPGTTRRPGGGRHARRGVLCRVRIEDYGGPDPTPTSAPTRAPRRTGSP